MGTLAFRQLRGACGVKLCTGQIPRSHEEVRSTGSASKRRATRCAADPTRKWKPKARIASPSRVSHALRPNCALQLLARPKAPDADSAGWCTVLDLQHSQHGALHADLHAHPTAPASAARFGARRYEIHGAGALEGVHGSLQLNGSLRP